MRSSVLIALLVLAGFIMPAHAEAPFSFETTPGKLPKNVVPASYSLRISPDLKTLTFKGEEAIRITVRSATSNLVLNALNLEIATATLSGKGIATRSLSPKLDAAQQTLSFALARPLAPGDYELAIRYSGVINPQAQGLYYDKYPTAQGEKLLLGSQMEPTDARRLLPSWDEPSFRASFQLTVDLPANFTAYSNTPAMTTELLPDGLRRTVFGATPKMASYLVVLVAGELERIADTQDGAEIGVVTTEGKKASAQYTLDISRQLLHYYNDYFGVGYPLKKLDQIGTPGGFGGAMENWGGIVYNDSAVLFDPAKSSAATKERVYVVVSHEMAHQWFGDLVTMAWWDNLWLNEGFASWMSTKATDHFNPDWDFWLAANSEREKAMALDARRTTHPIQQPVRNESEANDAFDDITYLKGQSFLRMLETYLGDDDFRKGIRAYILKHRYSNTTTADLWAALEKASGKPVLMLAREWTSQPGFPVVKVDAVCKSGRRRITLRQQQFKLDDDRPGQRLWSIPVAIGTAGGKADYSLLSTRSTTVTRPGCDGALVLDPDAVGYYRVEYAPPLFEALRSNFATLPTGVRLKLLSDTWALVAANRAPVAAYLELATMLGNEPKAALWEQVLDSLDTLDDLARDEPVRDALRGYTVRLLAPKFATLGWDARADEPFQNAELRNKLLVALGKRGDAAVIAAARARFQRFLADPASLPPSIIDPVVAIVGRHADAATYEALLKLANAALTTEERTRYYDALASAEDPGLAAKTLPLALSAEVPPLFANRIVALVADNEHLSQAWTYAKINGDALIGNVAQYSRNGFFPGIAEASSNPVIADELEAHVKAHLPPEAGTEAHRGADAIRFRAKFKARVLPELSAALKAENPGGSVKGAGSLIH